MKREEQQLQTKLCGKLTTLGWNKIETNNLDKIKLNFKQHVERRNYKKLTINGIEEFSVKEFDRIWNHINSFQTTSEYAKTFLDDDFPIKLDNGKEIYINIFNRKKWCNNTFEFAEEVTFVSDSEKFRFDIVLFINGIPICDVELKKADVNLQNAFEQTQNYSNKIRGFFKFIQMFIISNGNYTKYYSNNKKINPKFAFNWVDEENNIINDLDKFADHFLESCIFAEYISKYVINKEESSTLIAMRGYQVHGAKKAINQIIKTSKNAFLWHATGSGKTITSFKTAQIITHDYDEFDKVIFLVDRRDLDAQTIAEYNSFLPSTNKIQETTKSIKLFNQLKSTNKSEKLIISTIQKLSRLLKSETKAVKSKMNELKELKIVFIIDECHRSQFGDMHHSIKEHFKNAKYIGFTGTPIFPDEVNKIATTNIFDECVHKYLIQNAIADKNVLPFQIDYYQFEEGLEVNDNNYLKSQSYIQQVVKDIIRYHDRKTNRKYEALLCVSSIDIMFKFYEEFKNQQEQKLKVETNYQQLKIAATCSIGNDHNSETLKNKEKLAQVIEDFNNHSGANCSIEDVSAYNSKLQQVLKNSKNDVPKIDIAIVVDQLLTGFDAPIINTLYVAKKLSGHNLIQAFSRTNRIFDTGKEAGQIVCFVPNMKENVEQALEKYSDKNNIHLVQTQEFEELENQILDSLQILNDINYDNIIDFPQSNIQSSKVYVEETNKLYDAYLQIRTMRNYDLENTKSYLKIEDVNKLIRRTTRIKEVYKKPLENGDISETEEYVDPTLGLEFPLEIQERGSMINSKYILGLLTNLLSAKEQKNEIAFNSYKENIINALTKHAYKIEKEILTYIKNDIQEEPKVYFKKLLDEQIKQFNIEFNATDEKIDEQLVFYKYKERFNEQFVNKMIKEKNIGIFKRKAIRDNFDNQLFKIMEFKEFSEL